MKIIITGKNFSLTPSLNMYVEKKLNNINKFYNQISRAKVELDVDKNQKSGDIYRVEIWLSLPKKVIQAGEKAGDMHEAIDLAEKKVEQRLVRYKEKLRSQIRKSKKFTRG